MKEQPSREEQLVLETRAAELAKTNTLCSNAENELEVVVFSSGRDTYGIESSFVFEIEKISNITPLPDSLRGYSGISNFRGTLLPMIDLRKLFGQPQTDQTEFEYMIVVGRRQVEAGLLTHSVDSIRSISENLATDTNFIQENHQGYIRGIASGGMVVLAVDILLDSASRTD